MSEGYVARETIEELTRIVEDYPEVKAQRNTYQQSYERCDKLLSQTKAALRDAEHERVTQAARKRFWRSVALVEALGLAITILIIAL